MMEYSIKWRNTLRLSKLVQTCSNLSNPTIWQNSIKYLQWNSLVNMFWYNFKLVKTCQNLSKTTIWRNHSTNMSRHIIMLMMWFDRILKHVQTCHNAYDAIWYDFKHVQTCHNAYDAIWYDSQTCLILFRINVIQIATIHMIFKHV
jgi:hypothetical protein